MLFVLKSGLNRLSFLLDENDISHLLKNKVDIMFATRSSITAYSNLKALCIINIIIIIILLE